jgi:hypothetical protein
LTWRTALFDDAHCSFCRPARSRSGHAEGGRRTGILIMDITAASDIPRIAEPWFLALEASIEATPAMIPEDLQKAALDVEQAVKAFAATG